MFVLHIPQQVSRANEEDRFHSATVALCARHVRFSERYGGKSSKGGMILADVLLQVWELAGSW